MAFIHTRTDIIIRFHFKFRRGKLIVEIACILLWGRGLKRDSSRDSKQIVMDVEQKRYLHSIL